MHITLVLVFFLLVACLQSRYVHALYITLASGDLVTVSGDGNGEDLSIRLRETICTDEGIL